MLSKATPTQIVIACVASVSVGFSARSRHFSLFGAAKIRTKRVSFPPFPSPLLVLFLHSPNFREFKSKKSSKPAESPTETLATQAKIVKASKHTYQAC